jgi:hypothetical protein
MFWSKKKKTDKRPGASKSASKASCGSVGTTNKSQRQGNKLSSEEIRAQALANARAARERIGEETIQKIAEALVRKQMSLTEQAKKQIAQTNSDRVADEIRLLMGENETRH